MATLALRIEPGPVGSGVDVRFELEPRLVPLYIFKTPDAFKSQLTAYASDALAEGLAGWVVTDCLVTVTDCGYANAGSTAADFRHLTTLLVATALDRAGTWVCEPLADLALEMPSSTAPGVLGALGRLGGRVTGQFSSNGVYARLGRPVGGPGALPPAPAARPVDGRRVLETRPGGYQPIGEDAPTRTRSGPSPLDRDAWLASLTTRG